MTRENLSSQLAGERPDDGEPSRYRATLGRYALTNELLETY